MRNDTAINRALKTGTTRTREREELGN